MSAFDGGNGWRTSTPFEGMKLAAQIGAQTGQIFASSYNAAADRKADSAKLGQQQKQFDASMLQRAAEFNILNPDMTKPWGGAPAATPGWNAPTMGFAEGGRPPVGETVVVGEKGPELFVADQPGRIIPNAESAPVTNPGTRWDGSKQPRWLDAQPNWRATNALDVLGKITQAQSFEDLATIQKQNPEAGMYPQVQKALQQKSMILQRGVSAELATARAENAITALKSNMADTKLFNQRALTIAPEFRAELRALKPNADGSISTAQWQSLDFAEHRMEEHRKQQAELAMIDAKLRGDQQRTTITDKGVTKVFSPTKPEEAAGGEPITKTLPSGQVLAWMPNSKSMHVINPKGENETATASQAMQLARLLNEANDPEYTNFVNLAKEMFKSEFKAPAGAPAASAGAVFDFVPGKGLQPVK
jgi:hypothetical protein